MRIQSPPPQTQQSYQPGWRFWFIVVVLALALMALVWRLFTLTVSERAFLKHQGDARTVRILPIPAYRGMIADRNGEPLAISTPVNGIWINPKTFASTPNNRRRLAEALSLNEKQLAAKIKQHKKRTFLYLKRQVDPATTEAVMALRIPGVYRLPELRRYYPSGEVMAQLIGFTNVDDVGQEGLELGYNQWLEGIPGKKQVIVDRLGRVVEEIQVLREAQPGNNLVLSIDKRLQYLTHRALLAGIKKFKAKAASAVILNVKTGEVLAMVNVPSFNPNNRTHHNPKQYRNTAVTDVFEPGSTLKTFSVAAALTSGQYQPDTPVDTSPGWMMVGRNRVKDYRNYGPLDVSTVLQHSSNVGVTKMILSLPDSLLPNFLNTLGFGKRTGVDFPGEENGYVPHHDHWRPFELATLSFGYAMNATNLQLAAAYATIANHGKQCKPSLLLVQEAPDCRSVMLPHIADSLSLMLEQVVEQSAVRAQVPGYRVGGKTGTVRMIGPHGYDPKHHLSLFAGFGPISDPQLVLTVVVKDPLGGQYYGSLVAAPLFAEIMGGALRITDANPDKLMSPELVTTP